MDRRKFLKTIGLAGASTFAAPYILPSGRLFAATGEQLAAHVVFVLFAGGVRHQESVGKRYLADSQFPYTNDVNVNVEGNIMSNMLIGDAPEKKLVYGTDPPIGQGTPGSIPIPKVLAQPMQKQGTLFQEMICGTAGHYLGLSALLSGNYAITQGLRQKPVNPTIFEYVRRHLGETATKTWFIGNGTGNSTPLLNYSSHANYGVQYGANFFAPSTTFGQEGITHLSNAKNYHPDEDLPLIYEMANFLNDSFFTTGGILPSLGNTEAEKYDIKQFMNYLFEKGTGGVMAPIATGAANGDVRTVAYTSEVLKWFKPTLTVVNMSSVDGCHENFTGYLRSLHRADYAVGYLWNLIQTQIPEMANNTIMIVAPEHGRNSEPNTIKDFNDWFAYDHSDENARRNFALMIGPDVPQNVVLGAENNPIGDTAQCALTIAEILGIKQEVLTANRVINGVSLFDLL